MEIQGSTVYVPGGASGLGAATARHMADNGAKVALFDLNEEAGQALADELGGVFIRMDVTDADNVTAAFDAAREKIGRGRILVNCAGVAPPAKAVDREGMPLPLEKFTTIININLNGSFNTASKFAAQAMPLDLVGEERGVIINTASVAAFDGQIGQPAYGASKAGVVGMTLPLAREFARHAIRVMTIAPGIFMTPMMSGLPEDAQKSLGQQVPFPSRLGQPEEYAQLAASIVANPMLNGETIRLDGAIRMAPK